MKTEITNKNSDFPSARYFQVHFEYLEDLLVETKQRLDTLKQVIIEAQQSEMSGMTEQPSLNLDKDKTATSVILTNRSN